jgi:hypothetical protein
LDIKRLNYGIMTLLPKVKNVVKIEQFRPICLLNYLYKWFTKVLTIRLEPIAGRIVHIAQSAFIGGRCIISNILALHEILHETKRRKKVGIVLKFDFEKAYDKVNWNFLIKCLRAMGFNQTWCSWIEKVLQDGTVAVKVNGVIGPYFQSHQGVRQGDPLSPLFNFIAYCLTKMVIEAQENNRIVGLVSNLIPKGIAIMQYADDTIMCLEADETQA